MKKKASPVSYIARPLPRDPYQSKEHQKLNKRVYYWYTTALFYILEVESRQRGATQMRVNRLSINSQRI